MKVLYWLVVLFYWVTNPERISRTRKWRPENPSIVVKAAVLAIMFARGSAPVIRTIFNSKAFPLISLSLSILRDRRDWTPFYFHPPSTFSWSKAWRISRNAAKARFFMEKLSKVGGNCFLIHVLFISQECQLYVSLSLTSMVPFRVSWQITWCNYYYFWDCYSYSVVFFPLFPS